METRKIGLRAKTDSFSLKRPTLRPSKIDRPWTLFGFFVVIFKHQNNFISLNVKKYHLVPGFEPLNRPICKRLGDAPSNP